MTRFDLALRSRMVITPGGEQPATVCVANGTIAGLTDYDTVPSARQVIDCGDDALLPGLVDTHVHVDEPGRDAEGYFTATRAAAAGGVTTVIDMPLNAIPPTTSAQALELKRQVADGRCFVDVGFWGGLISDNLGDLPGLDRAGVFGFKCYLPGAPNFSAVSPAGLKEALQVLRDLDQVTIVHAEEPGILAAAPKASGPRFTDYLASRPPQAEVEAVRLLTELSRDTGARVHVVHLSAADALPDIRRAKEDGIPITVETCPHYLTFTAEEIPDGATVYKCAPPNREAANRERLWSGLSEGVIDCIVSDHAPHTLDEKHLDTGDFAAAGAGISSLQLGLPAVWTQARERGYCLADVVRWMAIAPAALVGLRRKGRIAVGYDADLVRFAPDETFTVDPAALHHRVPITAYAGRTLTGMVRTTWLRGVPVDGEPCGQLLVRGKA